MTQRRGVPRRVYLLVAGAALVAAVTLTPPAMAQAATGGQLRHAGCSAASYRSDPRLGPARLAGSGELGVMLAGYHRLGGMTSRRFLNTYWNPAANSGEGGWRYPPDEGYLIGLNGRPVEVRLRLAADQEIDRFGSVHGTFLSPDDMPYALRALPPQNLDGVPAAGCNYHEYRVTRAFTVESGPVAPWFGQPGYGFQYELNPKLIPGAPATLNVLWLLQHRYLRGVSRH